MDFVVSSLCRSFCTISHVCTISIKKCVICSLLNSRSMMIKKPSIKHNDALQEDTIDVIFFKQPDFRLTTCIHTTVQYSEYYFLKAYFSGILWLFTTLTWWYGTILLPVWNMILSVLLLQKRNHHNHQYPTTKSNRSSTTSIPFIILSLCHQKRNHVTNTNTNHFHIYQNDFEQC